MSLRDLTLSLLSGIKDPRVRIDVSTTIYYLRDVYSTGRVSEEEIRESLYEVIETIIKVKEPDLLPEERKKKVERLVEQFMDAIKLETSRIRIQRVLRGRLMPPT